MTRLHAHEDDRLLAALALLKMPRFGPVRVRKALSALRQRSLGIDRLFHQDGLQALQSAGLEPKIPDIGLLQQIAQQLAARGVTCLIEGEESSPLGAPGTPPIVFCIGKVELLSKAGVGFCGSRHATQRGIEVASDIADQLASLELNVVSGGARGVDTASHIAALNRPKGTTTVVLAEGILTWRPKVELRNRIDWARTLVVSEFFPEDTWAVGRAMQRNATIGTTSKAMVLIEAREEGGTFSAGQTCLRLGVPLFCAVYTNETTENDGNRILLGRGANPLMLSKRTNRANIAPIVEAVSRGPQSPELPFDQQGYHDT